MFNSIFNSSLAVLVSMHYASKNLVKKKVYSFENTIQITSVLTMPSKYRLHRRLNGNS